MWGVNRQTAVWKRTERGWKIAHPHASEVAVAPNHKLEGMKCIGLHARGIYKDWKTKEILVVGRGR